MDQAAVDHRRTQAMEQSSLEGSQPEGRTTVERTYDAENKAENIPNYQTDADIRTVLEQQRQAVGQTMTRLRGGTNELRIETGRYPITNRDRRLEVEERRCLICMSGEIEDESHFVVDCAFYDDLREKFKNVLMKEGIEFGEERKTEAGCCNYFSEPDYKERTRRRQPSCAKKL
jgi:hypothetical protein